MTGLMGPLKARGPGHCPGLPDDMSATGLDTGLMMTEEDDHDNKMANTNICNKCQKEAFQKCGGCQKAFYCSREHQKLDWKQHKKHCQPFEVSFNATIGRHLIATLDVKPNKIILKEQPLIDGPSQNTIPVCLGCCQTITENNYTPCSKCGWPMCSEQCETNPSHKPECEYTSARGEKVSINNFGVVHPFYSCITVLRCLYQKRHKPDVWKKLDSLQSHCEERKSTEEYSNEKVTVAQFVRNFFELKNEFSEDGIMRVCGIVMVNAHEIPLSDPPYIAIYEKTSMFENDCKANCNKSFTEEGELLIVSGPGIGKKDHLSICYADSLWSTINRRQFLHETKFFWCSCKRCSDPTEFGTYFSAVRCQNGICNGHLLPKTFLSPQEETENWYCNKCSCMVSYLLVNSLLEKIGMDLANLDKNDVTACKRFISKFEKLLPPNNFLLTDAKLALAQLIGQESPSGLSDVSNGDLELKRKLCQELVDLTETLIPSEKRVRGLLLFELHASLAELGRRRSINFLNTEDVITVLKESRICLMKCIELLKFEPVVLPEGKIYQQALKNLNDLNQLLRRQNVVIEDVL